MTTPRIALMIGIMLGLFPISMCTAQTPHIGDMAELPGNTAAPKMEKVTYLGVTSKPVDQALRTQLNLPEGVGLVVTAIDGKGPAAADIQENDVLQKLDDQLLIDAHQLVTLIHLHHPGDAVTLTIIRAAKPMQVTVKLGEKKRPADPVDHASDFKPLEDPFDAPLPIDPLSQVGFSFKDELYSASISTDPSGHKTLTVRDNFNKIVAHGPADTADQWEKFPPEIRTHLDVMRRLMDEQQK